MANIRKQIEDSAFELFGQNFKFRKWQDEAVLGIVESVLSKTKHTLMEAPTGSGKSITAIIAAYVLYKYYAKTSYILVSDLSLFAQYENDIAKLNANYFGCIKGKENYICNSNGCPASQSECSLAGVSISSLVNGKDEKFTCSEFCKYVHDYRTAMHSPITLMTYQLYFIQRNYVEDSLFGGNNRNFPARDLVICDECHNICSICQSHFSPIVNISRPKWMDTLDEYAHASSDELKRSLIVQQILDAKTNETMLNGVYKYASYLEKYCGINESIRSKLANAAKLTSKDKHALMAGNRARQEHCKFTDMFDFIQLHGNIEYVVKSPSDDQIAINFIYDDMMLKKYFHAKSKCEMLMSATIGDFNKFAELTGLDSTSTNVMRIPSTFNFSKSPIYYSIVNKMSYATKSVSLPAILKQIVGICKSNSMHRGIIQTGSYENAEYLKHNLPSDILSRCMFYRGSGEKSIALDQFLDVQDDKHMNRILIGPTLLEGLNFPDDVCRFQICMKIPYAHLGNEYVRKKKDLVDGWYEYDACEKIRQGIGRGIRHENDWCKTYIVDGCIQYLLRKLEDDPVLSGRFAKI